MSRKYIFSRWLVNQNERNDSVGAFARFVMSDDDVPIGAYRPAAYRRYMTKAGAPQIAIDGITPAFREFARCEVR